MLNVNLLLAINSQLKWVQHSTMICCIIRCVSQYACVYLHVNIRSRRLVNFTWTTLSVETSRSAVSSHPTAMKACLMKVNYCHKHVNPQKPASAVRQIPTTSRPSEESSLMAVYHAQSQTRLKVLHSHHFFYCRRTENQRKCDNVLF